MLKLRLARPALLVDLGRVPALRAITPHAGPSRYCAHLATVVTRRAISRALATTLTPAT
jgi:hypothetical protein